MSSDTESAVLPSTATSTEIGLATTTEGGVLGDVTWVLTDTHGTTVLEVIWSGTSIRYRTSDTWLCAPGGTAPVDTLCSGSSIPPAATTTSVVTVTNTSVALYVTKQLVLKTTVTATPTRLAVTVTNGTITSFVVTNQGSSAGSSSTGTMPVWGWVLVGLGIVIVIALIGVAVYAALKKKGTAAGSAGSGTITLAATLQAPGGASTAGLVL